MLRDIAVSGIVWLRRFARREPAALVIAAGILVDYLALGLMHNVTDDIVMPFVQNAFTGDSASHDLTWTVGGATLRFATIIEDALVLVAAIGIAFVIAVHHIAEDSAVTSVRCPECRSSLVEGARRCAFCRSDVEVSG